MHTEPPHFSIITPAYRSAGSIGATIDSVLAQTDPDWELVIVDDGSDDETLAIARSHAESDARITVLTQANAGTSAARNTAMAASRGSWLVFLDADDELLPTYLENQRAFIAAHPGHGIYATNAWVVYPSGTRHLFWSGRHGRLRSIGLADELRRNHINIHSTVPRSLYEKIGGFTPGLRAQDYEYWLRAMLAGYTAIMNPEPLVDYHVVDGSLSTDPVVVVGSIVDFIEQLAADAPESMSELFAQALTSWRGRLEIAEMQNRMLDGEYAGARSVFWRNARHLPDWRKIPVGGALVLLSPALYRRVLLGRFERSRDLTRANNA